MAIQAGHAKNSTSAAENWRFHVIQILNRGNSTGGVVLRGSQSPGVRRPH